MKNAAHHQAQLKSLLEGHYQAYNRREWVHPDPLEFLYAYPDVRDREVVGLIASALAYGRVAQILRSVAAILKPLGPKPATLLRGMDERALVDAFSTFKHRWTTGREVAALLAVARELLRRHDSLEQAFTLSPITTREELLSAMERFAAAFDGLLPTPSRGSACKRYHLFLRWMVRCDAVDPGGWSLVSPAALIVPVDVHLHRIAGQLRLTRRKNANLKTALEITEAFARLVPEDPVRYDFALTRFGLHPRLSKTPLGLA